MKSFNDLNIKKAEEKKVFFTGDKVKMSKILNRSIIVIAYKIEDSRYEGKCLYLQIAIGDTKHVVFTGSKNLMEIIQLITPSDFPFATTIIEQDERFEFT